MRSHILTQLIGLNDRCVKTVCVFYFERFVTFCILRIILRLDYPRDINGIVDVIEAHENSLESSLENCFFLID